MKSCMRTSYGLMERLEPKKGVHQGCVLSPILFNVVMNEIKNKVIGGNTTPDMKTLIYAADTVIWNTSKKFIEYRL